MKRIGILGGTFNPVHVGHLAVADYALQQLDLDKVIFVPSSLPPHKTASGVVESQHRYNMLKLAIGANLQFEICDYEIQKGGKSYSIETVEYLKLLYSEKTKFYFIIGEDNFSGLSKWKDINRLVKLVDFVVVSRPESSASVSSIKVKFLKMPGLDVSSTYIRKNIAQRSSIRYLIPALVWDYIEKHKLYLDS